MIALLLLTTIVVSDDEDLVARSIQNLSIAVKSLDSQCKEIKARQKNIEEKLNSYNYGVIAIKSEIANDLAGIRSRCNAVEQVVSSMAQAVSRLQDAIRARQHVDEEIKDSVNKITARISVFSEALGDMKSRISQLEQIVAEQERKEQERRIAEAKAKFEAAEAQQRHEGAIAHYNQAVAYQHNRDLRRAFDCYNEAIRLDPNIPIAYAGRGSILWAWNRKAEGKADFDRAKELGYNTPGDDTLSFLGIPVRHTAAPDSWWKR